MYISIRWAKSSEYSEQLNYLLSLFEQNPFHNFNKASYGFENIKKYDRNEAVLYLMDSDDSSIKIEESEPQYVRGTVTTDVPVPFVNIVTPNKAIKTDSNLEEIIKYSKEWKNLEGFLSVTVSADDRDNEFWLDVAKTPPLPDCLGSRLGWYHIVSAREYEPYFRREDLLNAPVLHVEELSDFTICLQSYEHPLDYNNPVTTKKIVEITNYLYQKWREFDPSPTI